MSSGPDPIPLVPGNAEIIDIYALTLSRLKAVIAGEDFTTASKRRATAKIIEIRRHIAELRRTHNAWAKKFIPDAYRIGTDQDIDDIVRLLGSSAHTSFGKLHQEAARVAVQGAVQDFGVVADALDNTYVGYVRRAQITGNKRAIANEIAGGIIEGAGRETVVNRLLIETQRKAVKGLIVVGQRTLNARVYADLLARTLSRAVRTEGTINRLTENDIDLVIISDTGAVDFCTEYENQIFSISGKSSRYPKLTARTPLHINCTHTTHGYIPEFAENGEDENGRQFKLVDVGKTAKEMNKKYPIKRDDTRTRTKKTQKAA